MLNMLFTGISHYIIAFSLFFYSNFIREKNEWISIFKLFFELR